MHISIQVFHLDRIADVNRHLPPFISEAIARPIEPPAPPLFAAAT